MARYTLSDDISSLKGIGSRRREQLEAAGIETIGDLLSYYPVKYKDRRHLVRAMDAGTEKDSLTCGRLIKVQLRPLSGGRSITECTLRDDSCVFYAVFFCDFCSFCRVFERYNRVIVCICYAFAPVCKGSVDDLFGGCFCCVLFLKADF